MTLVDTNVLLDVVTDDARWAGWSNRRLEAAALSGPLLINPVIYAELSVRFQRIEVLEQAIADAELVLEDFPRPALFLAGKVFLRYRGAGGTRTSVLPDFLIGAHAAVAGHTLLTRDAGRYATYYPTVRLITPRTDP